MRITGIVCEYNPLHLGHKKQIDLLKQQGHAVVCLMSGNFVQRGHPAIFDKMTRARAAIDCGADLVLELPLPYALSSAEAFASGGVQILSKICDNLCFGAEDADTQKLMQVANMLLSSEFSEKLPLHLQKGLSFPAARSAALADCGLDPEILATPNNILAVEYCKAIFAQNSPLIPMPIMRQGNYHDVLPDAQNPSATAIRSLIGQDQDWLDYVPHHAVEAFQNAKTHTLAAGEKAILARLRTMTDDEFQALPYGSEGLWRKLMHACRECADLEEIIANTKSKRYTRTRIDRMILCAFLGINKETLDTAPPYTRILGFNDTGRSILRSVKDNGYFINIGVSSPDPYGQLEHRTTALYGLFADMPDHPDAEHRYRVYYRK